MGNTLRIIASGLQIDHSAIYMNLTGIVVGAQVADINADRSPEIYIYVQEPGPENRMTLVAYSANKKKSLSQINLPPLSEAKGASIGYCGNDIFALAAGHFVHSFPLCDKNRQATLKRLGCSVR